MGNCWPFKKKNAVSLVSVNGNERQSSAPDSPVTSDTAKRDNNDPQQDNVYQVNLSNAVCGAQEPGKPVDRPNEDNTQSTQRPTSASEINPTISDKTDGDKSSQTPTSVSEINPTSSDKTYGGKSSQTPTSASEINPTISDKTYGGTMLSASCSKDTHDFNENNTNGKTKKPKKKKKKGSHFKKDNVGTVDEKHVSSNEENKEIQELNNIIQGQKDKISQLKGMVHAHQEKKNIREKTEQDQVGNAENNEHLRKCNEKIEKLEAENKQLRTRHHNSGPMQSYIEKIRQLEHENDSLRTRLSEIASTRLRDGNENIADLSDENRPTKLAEKFSELYDNEWTDAFDVVAKNCGAAAEEDAIFILFKALCTIYTRCRDTASYELTHLRETLTEFLGDNEALLENLKVLKDARKKNLHADKKKLNQAFKQDIEELLKDEETMANPTMNTYLDKCIELCWLMVIQDPPVFMDVYIEYRGKTFDSNKFKPYTKSGKYIDFVVWPPIYLKEGGNVLSKGVAQGAKSRSSKTPVFQTNDSQSDPIHSEKLPETNAPDTNEEILTAGNKTQQTEPKCLTVNKSENKEEPVDTVENQTEFTQETTCDSKPDTDVSAIENDYIPVSNPSEGSEISDSKEPNEMKRSDPKNDTHL